MNNPATSSGQIAASAIISSLYGRLKGVMVEADGTNAATVIIYDNTAASGTILAKVQVKAGEVFGQAIIADSGICANNGIYCAISGTGAKAIVHYHN